MVSTTEIHVLLIAHDVGLVTCITKILRELGVDAQKSAATNGVPRELARAKYEAILLDFDTVLQAQIILAGVRANPANKGAVLFAVATEKAHREYALRQGANFILERPFDESEVRRVLHAAYSLMARERRKYFRSAVEVPVLLTRTEAGTALNCTTINISSSGVAVRSPSTLNAGEEVELALSLWEGEPAVRAKGTVAWDDKHGKAGIGFDYHVPQERDKVEAWLSARFYNLLPAPELRDVREKE
jgi:DNA-binding response OmpR family regulator